MAGTLKKKYGLRDFLPHVLGMLLVYSGLLHFLFTTLLFFGIGIESISIIITGTPFWNRTFIYAGEISSIFLGIWLILTGIGIYKKHKKAVYSAILLLFLSSMKYMLLNSMPQMVFLNLFFLILLIFTWRYFKHDNSQAMKNYQEIVAWLTVVLALVYGITGSYMLREHYVGLKSVMDAVYYTIITYSTVGYGDIYPTNTEAKIFTITMVLIGLGSFATAVSFIIGPKIESKVKGIFNIMGNLNHMKDHIILCGFSDLTKAIVKQLKANDIPYIIIDNSPEVIHNQFDEEYMIFKGLISSVKTFEDVNIRKARAVIVAFDRDPENVLTTLTIKEALENVKNADSIKVITRIENENNLEKARKIGVHEIISPSTLAAKSIIGSL